MKHRFISIDLETTGLDVERDQILQIGAVAYGGDGDPVEFVTDVRHERYSGSAYALALNAAIFNRLADRETAARTEPDAILDLFAFVWGACEPEPYPVGFNVGRFDVTMIKCAARRVENIDLAYDVDRMFHHRAVELGSLLAHADGTPRSSAETAERYSWTITHDALQDARDAAVAHARRVIGLYTHGLGAPPWADRLAQRRILVPDDYKSAPTISNYPGGVGL